MAIGNFTKLIEHESQKREALKEELMNRIDAISFNDSPNPCLSRCYGALDARRAASESH